jgi:BolA family transcriptional regulator, general stress-responsive regulator
MTEYYAPWRTRPSRLDNAATAQLRRNAALTSSADLHTWTRMQTADVIARKLTEAFAPQSLKVEDESHRHEGHAGWRPGGQTHYRVYIVSEAFKGKTRLERHRMVNSALAGELAGGIHALAIHAAAPGEGGV